MSATTIAQIRDKLGESLAAILGVTVYPLPQAVMSMPAVTIMRTGTFLHEEAQGTARYELRVSVYVTVASDKSAQAKLDSFVDVAGSKSVTAALESNVTLGGIADDVTVHEIGADSIYERAAGGIAAQYLGADFTVHVLAPTS